LTEYNARSQMTSLVDAVNQRYEFVYDALGRVTQEKEGTATKSFAYDAPGNRTQRTDYNNATANYTYDTLNRLTNIAYPDNTSATYNYDALSRLSSAANGNGAVTIAYDNRGRLSSVNDVFAQTVGYSYDANGNRTQITVGGATNASYQYDTLNRLTQLTDAASLSFTFAYDTTNKLTSRTAPNGVTTTYQYDGLDRLTRLTHAKGATTIADFQYQFNAANDITQIIDAAGTHNYSYDSLDRLTTATHPSQTNESYTYDDVGNRTASHQGSSYTYQPFNRLTAANGNSYGYDGNGNLTSKVDATGGWAYSWDSENRLKQAALSGGVTVNYSYDALGRRIQRSDSNGGTTKFVYDGADVVRDLNANLTVAASYLNSLGIDDKLQRNIGGIVSYFLTDHLGSTRALTDTSGSVGANLDYDSFGNLTIGSPTTRHTFTGRELDPDTGLLYYRARWYNQQQGRFISEDPIDLKGGINLYTYVGDAPLGYVDPWGLERLNYILSPPPVQPASPPPLYPDNFDWWRTFWSTYWGLRNQACYANGGFDMGGGTCAPLPIMGCGVTFVTSPIKFGSAGGPTAGKPFPRNLRNEVLSGEPACVFCGEPATQVDHAIARAKGGKRDHGERTTCMWSLQPI
jgi:RHS repeat-associated protein